MKVKKRIVKKKLKEPDELRTFATDVYLFLNQHLKKLLLSGGVLLLIILMVVFYRIWQERKEDEANQKYHVALDSYQTASLSYGEENPEDYKKPLSLFDDLVRSYPGTTAGRYSLLYKGTIHLRMGDYDQAISAYQNFLKKAKKDKIYRMLALEGIGYAYEGKKDYEKAVNAYSEIVKSGETPLWSTAHLHLARCYEKMGKKQESIESYKAFLGALPKSQAANLALKKVSMAGQ
ncbi:MAG: tetratricopeptide repeat protein [Desulfobacterota bacterium]|nr:tetratricopeptide repeat protein [Thermodesulfobacteriota bacterium]